MKTTLIPANAERISWRSANFKRPPAVEPDFGDFGDGFSPHQARFGSGDERYTLALAGRVQLGAEEHQAGFSKSQEGDKTTYTGVTCQDGRCQAAVAIFQEDTGNVSFSEYRWPSQV